jgi:hypothetical protein
VRQCVCVQGNAIAASIQHDNVACRVGRCVSQCLTEIDRKPRLHAHSRAIRTMVISPNGDCPTVRGFNDFYGPAQTTNLGQRGKLQPTANNRVDFNDGYWRDAAIRQKPDVPKRASNALKFYNGREPDEPTQMRKYAGFSGKGFRRAQTNPAYFPERQAVRRPIRRDHLLFPLRSSVSLQPRVGASRVKSAKSC